MFVYKYTKWCVRCYCTIGRDYRNHAHHHKCMHTFSWSSMMRWEHTYILSPLTACIHVHGAQIAYQEVIIANMRIIMRAYMEKKNPSDYYLFPEHHTLQMCWNLREVFTIDPRRGACPPAFLSVKTSYGLPYGGIAPDWDRRFTESVLSSYHGEPIVKVASCNCQASNYHSKALHSLVPCSISWGSFVPAWDDAVLISAHWQSFGMD
jgi:hypothetical protein